MINSLSYSLDLFLFFNWKINQGDLQDGDDVYEEFSMRPVKANSLRFDVGESKLVVNNCLHMPLTILHGQGQLIDFGIMFVEGLLLLLLLCGYLR